MISRLGGRYQLLEELGEGGQARVYKAVDGESGRLVAAKVMIAGGADNLDALLRFQQEGALLSTLKHPNILEVYGTFLEGSTSYIIMELLEGQSLSQILRSTQLPLSRVKQVTLQVASALAFAHGRGIIHRDVKPNNIMVLGGDHVKVMDFGIARILRPSLTLNTVTGVSIGTPLYMAPEQIQGLKKVDARVDIYSLGAVVYRMVAGRPPFEGDDPLTIALEHLNNTPKAPSTVRPLPPGWDALILKALAKDPDNRFETAAEMAEALAALPSGEPGSPDDDAPTRKVGDGPVRGAGTTVLFPSDAPQPGFEAGTLTSAATRLDPTPPGFDETVPTAIGSDGNQLTHVSGQRGDATLMHRSEADVVPTAVGMAAGATAVQDRPHAGDQRLKEAAPPSHTRRRVMAGVAVLAFAVVVLLAAFWALRPRSTTPLSITHLSALGPRHNGAFASGARVRLVWSPVKGALYRLQVATGLSGSSDPITFSHPIRSLELRSAGYALVVEGAQTYSWRVQARIAGRWTAYARAPTFAATRPVIGTPALITPVDGAAGMARSVTLCWQGVSNASAYVVRVSGLPARTVPAPQGNRVPHQRCTTLAGLRPGTYRWSVAAQAHAARDYMGPASARRGFTVLPPIGRPRLLSPENGTSSPATTEELCWQSVAGATGYVLRVSGRAPEMVASACAQLNGLGPGIYQWSVAAQARHGRIFTGPSSAPAVFTILPRQVIQPTAAPIETKPRPHPKPTARPVVIPTRPARAQPRPTPPAARVKPTKPPKSTPCDPSVQVCK